MSTCAPTTLNEALDGAFLGILESTLVVSRLARTPDQSGGGVESYQDQPGTVPCHVAPAGGGELLVADRLGYVDAYTITVPYGMDLRVTDRLKALGRVFQVQYVPQVGTDHAPMRCIASVVA
jgi:head-tail adaptor